MDELTLIRDFTTSERAASPAERDRARAALTGHIERSSRPRRARRSWALAFAAALVLLLTGTALALGPLRGLFEGQPAPPQVKQSIADYNDFREQVVRHGLGGFVVRAEDATGLIRFRVGKVPVRVWTAPLVDGGACTFIETHGSRGLMIGPCVGAVNVQPPVVFGMYRGRDFGGLVGHVTDEVSRLEVQYERGRSHKLPLVQGFFATGVSQGKEFDAEEEREMNWLIAHQKRETRRHVMPPKKLAAHQTLEWKTFERERVGRRAAVRPVALTAFDRTGRPLQRIDLPGELPTMVPFPSASYYKGMHGLLQINTLSGTPAVLMVQKQGDENCEVVWYASGGSATQGDGKSRCGDSAMGTSSLGGNHTVDRTLLVGDAGEDAASAEVRFPFGGFLPLLLLEGRFLVELTNEQFAASPELVVRDASGQIISTRKLVRPHWP